MRFRYFNIKLSNNLGSGEPAQIHQSFCCFHNQTTIFTASPAIYVSMGETRPQGYKTISILNSAEHEIYPAHKC